MGEKAYCQDCRHYRHIFEPKFGINWELCMHDDKMIDTPTKRDRPFCKDANKNNDCQHYQAEPPKPPGFFKRLLGMFADGGRG